MGAAVTLEGLTVISCFPSSCSWFINNCFIKTLLSVAWDFVVVVVPEIKLRTKQVLVLLHWIPSPIALAHNNSKYKWHGVKVQDWISQWSLVVTSEDPAKVLGYQRVTVLNEFYCPNPSVDFYWPLMSFHCHLHVPLTKCMWRITYKNLIFVVKATYTFHKADNYQHHSVSMKNWLQESHGYQNPVCAGSNIKDMLFTYNLHILSHTL